MLDTYQFNTDPKQLTQKERHWGALFIFITIQPDQLQPLVAPQVSHFRQVPLRTMVKF